jgi:hypothetical protein
MTQRWTFYDTVALDTVTIMFNPNKMTSPFLEHETVTTPRSPIDGMIRANRRLSLPKEFSFGGFIRSQAQHDQLLALSTRKSMINVVDHLDRSFSIRFVKFDVVERKPTKSIPWRFVYTMRCLTYGVTP